jgi:very-short-patch-repair endonuclease
MTERARRLRTLMTEAERRLWARLRGDSLGVRFRRKLVIGQQHIVDFCAPAIRLVVEVDSGHHTDSPGDAARDRALEGLGYRVLRFRENAVLAETHSVIDAILVELSARPASAASPLSPLRGGERKRPGGDVVPVLYRSPNSAKDQC